MLKVSNLTKSYGNLKVLKGISFEAQKVGIYGFLGENGAGKSTTMNIVAGLIGYDSGEIYLNGKALNENKRELLQKVGYLPQNPVFYNYMTAIEYLNFIGEVNPMPSTLYFLFNICLVTLLSSLLKKSLSSGILTLALNFISIPLITIDGLVKFIPYNLVKGANNFSLNDMTFTITFVIFSSALLIWLTIIRMTKVEVI